MEDEKQIKDVQVITYDGEAYCYSYPTKAYYDKDSEIFVVDTDGDVTIFPREFVIAFRTVEDDGMHTIPVLKVFNKEEN